MKAKSWHVYVVECADGSYYCGVTNDLARRVREHNQGSRGAKYTRSRRPVSLRASWPHPNRSQAQKAEARFKRLSRARKEKIVERAHSEGPHAESIT